MHAIMIFRDFGICNFETLYTGSKITDTNSGSVSLGLT